MKRLLATIMLGGLLASYAVFVQGDVLGDALLVAGHRLKNAGTPVEPDGVLSLIALEQVRSGEELIQLSRARDAYREAAAETKAASMLRTARPKGRR